MHYRNAHGAALSGTQLESSRLVLVDSSYNFDSGFRLPSREDHYLKITE